MIVRTYGRRNRGIDRIFSDPLNEAVSGSLSEEATPSQEDIYSFPFSSSQDSSSLWPSSQADESGFKNSFSDKTRIFDFDDFEDGAVRRSKKQKGKESKKGVSWPSISLTSTLMEAQEFGEMMEHVDEVNFALDGLKKGQPLRIRRASLLSLLSICSTVQQRRLLRTQGTTKAIIDAILGLTFDDISSNLAAVTLFYVFTNDGEDEHLLESAGCIRFLIRMLKPLIPAVNEDKTRKLGLKLLALHKGPDNSQDKNRMLDSSSTAIINKVREILVRCQEKRSRSKSDTVLRTPELGPKWIALLTMEKGCLSKISFEDTTGTVRKTGGNFKEKLREFGGLDAVFEVTMDCHSIMEGWMQDHSSSISLSKDDRGMHSLVLLLNCLKIMENATCLSKDNQNHLLGMEGKLDFQGSQLSFTTLIIRIIKILSGLCLLKDSSISHSNRKACSSPQASGHASEFASFANHRENGDEVISISSSEKSSIMEWELSGKSFSLSQNDPGPSTLQLDRYVSNSEAATTDSADNTCSQKVRISSSISSFCSGKSSSLESRKYIGSNGSWIIDERLGQTEEDGCQLTGNGQDPFAFDEDEFEPSKWDLMSGKHKISQPQKRGARNRKLREVCQTKLILSQHGSSNDKACHPELINEELHQSDEITFSDYAEEESSNFPFDCLLTAVKVLMNLTNDNPGGCQQIASSEGLEAMSTLVANHFPIYCSFLQLGSEGDNSSSTARHLSDQELDFLVVILGLLVNLVEKDGLNRSRLASITISLPKAGGSGEENCMGVIPLLCSIFLANQGAGDTAEEVLPWNDEAALLQGEKEAEKMIIEAYAALLLAFLSTESRTIRKAIADHLPNQSLRILVPVLERFVSFHLTLNMIPPETHKAVSEVIESCRIP